MSHITVVVAPRKEGRRNGQKVQPTGFRLGVTESWRSLVRRRDYAEQLGNDLAIRKYLEKRLRRQLLLALTSSALGDKVKVQLFLRTSWYCHWQVSTRD